MNLKKKFFSLAVFIGLIGQPLLAADMQKGVTYEAAPKILKKGEATKQKEVTIYLGATSDLHGRLLGYDYAMDKSDSDTGLTRISMLVKAMRKKAPNMILIDMGDTVQGNSAEIFNDMPVHPMVESLNRLKYDIWVPGNHEFNFNRSFIDRNIQAFKGSVISSNIKWDEAGKSDSEKTNYVKAFQVFDVKGVKVGVVGITPSSVPDWEASVPDHFKDLSFEDELTATKEAVDKLLAQYHPDVVIGAMHLGRTNPSGAGVHDIAAVLADKFDVIFAGHEHAEYIEEITKGDPDAINISADEFDRFGNKFKGNLREDKKLAGVYNQKNRATKVKIIEPGKWGWAISTAEIKLKKQNGKWVLVDTNIANVTTKKIAEDPQILTDFKYVDEAAKKDARVSLGKIHGKFIPSETGFADIATGEGVAENGRLYSTIHYAKVHETPLMDFIINLQKQKAGADVSAASLFSDKTILIDGSDYTKGKSINLYKYGNTLIGVKMSGRHLKEYMEWSYAYFNTYKDGDLTVSFNPEIPAYNYDQFGGDIHYSVDLAKPAGERICIKDIARAPFDPSKTYKVVVNSYRFGSQLLSKGWADKSEVYYESTNDPVYAIRDMLTDYVREHKGLNVDDFDDDLHNWSFLQDVAFSSARAGKGKVLWNKLRNKEICVRIKKGAKATSIFKALNYKDMSSYTKNPDRTDSGCNITD